jgi:hypothetical protein
LIYYVPLAITIERRQTSQRILQSLYFIGIVGAHTNREIVMHTIIKTILLSLTLLASSTCIAGEVSRAVFTIGIDNREPVLSVDTIDSGSFTAISFFTELSDLSGHNVTHQWTYNGDVMFEKSFEVKGSRWRIWTSKTLIPSWTGTWTVNVLDDDRSVVTSKSFEYE